MILQAQSLTVSLEFMPYVFQILAQLLESSPADTISSNYKTLLRPLLNPPLWDVRGNVPACTRLLSAVIPRTALAILDGSQFEPVLGIFQKLLGGKKSENLAFDVLDAVIKTYEP